MSDDFKINWNFKKAIRERGYTLKKLEKATGINMSLLSMASTGRYILDNRQRRAIAKVIGVPENEIFD